MRVLSLFDGISCGHVALDKAGIPVEVYYASEIDKYAIQITQKNYPDTIQLGDVTKIDSLVSAQDRKRLYWTNIPNVTQPEDKQIYLEDVVEPDALIDRDKSHAILASIGRTTHREYFKKNQGQVVIYQLPRGNNKGGFKIYKAPTITTSSWEFNNLIAYKLNKLDLPEGEYTIRKVTPLECERLQTLPENYTEGISTTQRYKCIGNGWTVDVIAHIFSFIEEE